MKPMRGRKMRYEAPRIVDHGSISAHTFMATPPGGPNAGNGNHKGFTNCRIETTNCELSHPEDGGGVSP
jgi:hypothetical protein